MFSRALLTFSKSSRPGRVKTRLQGALGLEGARDLHEALLRDAIARMERLRSVASPLLYLAETPIEPPGVAYRIQGDGDLGDRMACAFAAVLAEGSDAACIVGADSPTFPDARVREAFDALARADVALGPCDDGGYYLIALRAPHPELFAGIGWGGDRVCDHTMQRARERGLAVELLAPHFDIDRPEDLDRVRSAAAELPAAERPVHTLAFLRRAGACPPPSLTGSTAC